MWRDLRPAGSGAVRAVLRQPRLTLSSCSLDSEPTLDPTADIPDNFDAVAARYAAAAPRYGIQFLTE
jgi:hypothetical protein